MYIVITLREFNKAMKPYDQQALITFKLTCKAVGKRKARALFFPAINHGPFHILGRKQAKEKSIKGDNELVNHVWEDININKRS
jgi:hypothetical protein